MAAFKCLLVMQMLIPVYRPKAASLDSKRQSVAPCVIVLIFAFEFLLNAFDNIFIVVLASNLSM